MLEGVDIISYHPQSILTTLTLAVSTGIHVMVIHVTRFCSNVCLESNEFIVERNVL